MSVVEFKPKQQTASGEAFCVRCGHHWVAVVPTGVAWFECPSCHAEKGMYRYSFQVAEGELVRECACGNQLFYLTPEGHLCPNCGIYQQYD